MSSGMYDLYIAPKCFLFLMARFWSRDYGRSVSLTENSHSLTVLVSIVSCLQTELNLSDKSTNANDISSRNSGFVNGRSSNIWDMKISAFSMLEDMLSKVASNMTENLWQSVIEVSSFWPHPFVVLLGAMTWGSFLFDWSPRLMMFALLHANTSSTDWCTLHNLFCGLTWGFHCQYGYWPSVLTPNSFFVLSRSWGKLWILSQQGTLL